MIYFLVTRGHEHCTRAIRQDASAPQAETLAYEDLSARSTLPRATYIFTDIDRLNVYHLIGAARLYRRLQEHGCRVLNDPAAVRTRFSLLRGLHQAGINPINAYLATEIETLGSDLADDKSMPRFPVFIRVADEHWGPLSDLIWNRRDLNLAIEAAVAAGFPRSTIIAVEYAAEPVRPNVFRKSSVYRIGSHFVPDIWWYEKTWNVKGDREGLSGEALYRAELEAIREDTYVDRVKDAFAFANIDFGRLDFGLVGDRICIFEINTNPTFYGPRPHPVAERAESLGLRWTKLLDALRAADTEAPADAELLDVAGSSITALAAAGAIYPGLHKHSLTLSKEQARRGDWSAALELVEAEIAAHPESVSARTHLRLVLQKLGRIDEAIAVAKEVLEASPRVPGGRRDLALLLLEAGRAQEALEMMQEALRSDTPDHHDHIVLARILMATGDAQAALQAAKRAVEMKPDDRAAAEWLARIEGQPNSAGDF